MENDEQLLIAFATKSDMSNNRISCLMQTIEDARAICQYDPIKGGVVGDALKSSDEKRYIFQNSFSGFTMYLASLEMIGKVFNKKPNLKDNSKSGIKRAVEQFSAISKEDKHAIFALRNALVHTAGLVNIPRNEKSNYLERHKFSLDYKSKSGGLIGFPKIKWDGNYTNGEEDKPTIIRVTPLIKAIEGIYSQLLIDLKAGEIELNLNGGIKELKAKYTLSI